MTCYEFISLMETKNALFTAAASTRSIILTNSALQNIRAAILPQFMIELYQRHGTINLGNGYIFGPTEVKRGNKYPIPSISQLNTDLINISKLRGKTVFGRNDLFWFAFDSFGICYMLDNVTLKELRKYSDPYKSLSDCLIIGTL